MGLGEPVAVSAEHGEGMADLYSALLVFDKIQVQDKEETIGGEDDEILHENAELNKTWVDEGKSSTLRLAIVGRPNVGKSTLINALLGQNRVLTGPESGITRDAIEVEWVWKDNPIKLFDTAGLR